MGVKITAEGIRDWTSQLYLKPGGRLTIPEELADFLDWRPGERLALYTWRRPFTHEEHYIVVTALEQRCDFCLQPEHGFVTRYNDRSLCSACAREVADCIDRRIAAGSPPQTLMDGFDKLVEYVRLDGDPLEPADYEAPPSLDMNPNLERITLDEGRSLRLSEALCRLMGWRTGAAVALVMQKDLRTVALLSSREHCYACGTPLSSPGDREVIGVRGLCEGCITQLGIGIGILEPGSIQPLCL